MSMQEKINGTSDAKLRESAMLKMYKNDKNFRADKLIEAWSEVPEIGAGLKDMPLGTARNTAINLDRQYNWMNSLKESQMSTALNNFTPENMLRLVRLAMPNIIRNKVFSDFALETTKDTIQYVRPFWAKTANGNDLNDRDPSYTGGANDPSDPFEYSKGGDFNADDFRKALYEDTRDRPNDELANGIVEGEIGGEVTIHFRKMAAADLAGISGENAEHAAFLSGKWGANGANYVDGYTMIYGYNPSERRASERAEQHVIAMQDKRSGEFFAAPGFEVTLVKPVLLRDKFFNKLEAYNTGNGNVMPGSTAAAKAINATVGDLVLEIKTTDDVAKKAPWYVEGETRIAGFARFNSEGDFEGNYLGEVEIQLADYQFKPRATAIGVSWSQLTEITLETSYGLSAEELLVTSASQEIRAALDYRAIRLGYAVAKTNASMNPNYYYVFDAAYNSGDGNANAARGKDGYTDNAQTVLSAFDTVGNIIYNEINRGGVSRLVAGPSACSYLKLNKQWSSAGKQAQFGAHQEGTLDGMPVFKVPNTIIPEDEILCVWKDDQNETEVSIAFGTLVPFFSTGIIQRKNFYKEAGIATYGDYHVLNRRFLAIVKLSNLKDIATQGERA